MYAHREKGNIYTCLLVHNETTSSYGHNDRKEFKYNELFKTQFLFRNQG